jgi:hypothetical protein
VKVYGLAVGQIRVADRCSDIVLIFALSWGNCSRLGCRAGVCPFGVGVVHGPSAGRAGNPRRHGGRGAGPGRGGG